MVFGTQKKCTRMQGSQEHCDIVLPYDDATHLFLQEAMDSLLNQQNACCILHVVAMGPTETPHNALLRQYAGHPQMRFHRTTRNMECYELLEYLYAKYETEYVAFQRSIDIALPHRIETSVAFLRQQPADIASFAVQNVLEGTNRENDYAEQLPMKNKRILHPDTQYPECMIRESMVCKKTAIPHIRSLAKHQRQKWKLRRHRMPIRTAASKAVTVLRRMHIPKFFEADDGNRYMNVKKKVQIWNPPDNANTDNVVLTTYFTKMPDPQSGAYVAPNDPDKMKLAESCAKMGLHCIVFHDNLDRAFCSRYPGITFVKIHTTQPTTSCNDLRFYVYMDWLERRNYTNVWLCDLFDVEIRCDPNRLDTEKKIWIGLEQESVWETPWWHREFHKAYGYGKTPSFLRSKPVLNAGVWGGDATEIMQFLRKFVTEIASIPAYDVNMSALNVLMHREHKQHIVMCTEPLVSKFKKYENRDDVCFIHK